jgi:hypothetical protein
MRRARPCNRGFGGLWGGLRSPGASRHPLPKGEGTREKRVRLSTRDGSFLFLSYWRRFCACLYRGSAFHVCSFLT